MIDPDELDDCRRIFISCTSFLASRWHRDLVALKGWQLVVALEVHQEASIVVLSVFL